MAWTQALSHTSNGDLLQQEQSMETLAESQEMVFPPSQQASRAVGGGGDGASSWASPHAAEMGIASPAAGAGPVASSSRQLFVDASEDSERI